MKMTVLSRGPVIWGPILQQFLLFVWGRRRRRRRRRREGREGKGRRGEKGRGGEERRKKGEGNRELI